MTAVVTLLSAGEAQRLTQRIKLIASSVRDNMFKLQALVDEAKRSNAWNVLGYESWTAYLSDTLASEPMRLGRVERQELVAYLSGEGMSTRAIAPIVGVDNKTVHNDLKRAAHVEISTPEPDSSVVELSPEVAPSAPAEEVTAPVEPQVPDAVTINPATGEVLDTPTITEHTVTEKTRTVVGLDGKTYNSSAASKPRRSSLVDDAFKANNDLWKAVERIRTIRRDDRFTRNKADILAALQPSVDLALEILTDL